VAELALTAWFALLAYLFFAMLRDKRNNQGDSGGGTSWDSGVDSSDDHGHCHDGSSSDGGGDGGGGGDGCD
jgi:hypothetical protein